MSEKIIKEDELELSSKKKHIEDLNLDAEYSRSNFILKSGRVQVNTLFMLLSATLFLPLFVVYILLKTFNKAKGDEVNGEIVNPKEYNKFVKFFKSYNSNAINDVDKKHVILSSIGSGIAFGLYLFAIIGAINAGAISSGFASAFVIGVIVHVFCGVVMIFKTDWWSITTKKLDLWSRKKPKRRKVYLNRSLYAMMAPYLLLFAIFTIAPVVMSFLLSFTYFNLLQVPRFIGFDNYLALFLDDPIFITAIKNTLIIAVICGPGGYLLSFLFAWLINELPNRIRPIITLIFYAPSLAGGGIAIWALIFHSDIMGYANAFLINMNLMQEPIQWLQNVSYILPIVIVVQLWMSLGVNFLTLIAGLKGVPRDQYEAGAVDGIRNRWQELWYITLPNMKAQLMFAAVLSISGALGVGAVSSALGGFPTVQYAGHTIVNHLQDFGSIRYEMGYASAIATLLFVSGILLNKLITKIIRKLGE